MSNEPTKKDREKAEARASLLERDIRLLHALLENGDGWEVCDSEVLMCACGCLWRRWADGTVSLLSGQQEPCPLCDNADSPPLRPVSEVVASIRDDYRAEVVAWLRGAAERHRRAARMFPQVAEESMAAARECDSLANALERGEDGAP